MKKIVCILAIFFTVLGFAEEKENPNKDNALKDFPVNGKEQLTSNIVSLDKPAISDLNSKNQKCFGMSCGYNASARYTTCGCYEFYTKASFIYWQPLQEGLTFAVASTQSLAVQGLFSDTSLINMNFDFKPGFKVGAGLGSDHDNWDVYLGYTWFHSTQSKDIDPPKEKVLLYYLWFNSQNTQNANQDYASNVKESWKLDMDIVDLELSRSHYVGKKLIFKPFVGGRALWINQDARILADIIDWGSREVKTSLESWALGARGGLNTNWILGYGFRTYGNWSASLLYTDYHKLVKNEDAINTDLFGQTYMLAKNKFQYLRTILDFSLGFGWGSYFSNKSNHFDIALGYDFNVFFHQNMMRFYSDELISNSGIEHSAGNLYLHGLNLSMQLDF